MLMPKRVKYRKQPAGPQRGMAWRGSSLAFGDFGLQALEPRLAHGAPDRGGPRRAHAHVKRGGRVWIRVFPDKPLTKKPAETRMGKGKGAPEVWVAVVKPGRMLFEMEGVDRGHRARGVPARGRTSSPSRPSSSSGRGHLMQA